MKKVVTIFCVSIFAACVATSKFAPTAEDLPAMQAKVPGLTYDEAIQGYKLYANNCSNCHRLHNPKEYTAVQWNKILPEMFGKAKLSNKDQEELIQNYLSSKSK